MARWTEEQKLKALAIAEASSAGEAAKQTGIPRGSILRWMSAAKNESTDSNQNESTNQNESNHLPKKVREISKQAIEEAKAEVKEYMIDRVKQVSDGLLELVEAAKEEAHALITTGQDPNDSKAQWLRSVVGAIAQGIEKYQILEGKPTQRLEVKGEVTNRNEHHYHFIQELINRDDEVSQRFIEGFRQSQSNTSSN